MLGVGGLCALGLVRRPRGAAHAVLSVGLIAGFLGFTLVTPQIVEHFLIIYGALLIVFLVTMPDGIAGLPKTLSRWRARRKASSADV